MEFDDEWNASLSTSKIDNFITRILNPLFRTYGKSRTITTVSSGTFTVSGGTFGKSISCNKEREQLMEEITNGETVEREPCYDHNRAYEKTTENDGIGNTYIDVNITTQTVTYVKKGEILLSSSCVTGDTSEKHDTPTGIYYITYRLTDKKLIGYRDLYAYYWLEINGYIGLHDATYRGTFGGTIYQKNGSYGSIELPLDKAKELYKNVPADTIVIIHK